METILSQVGKLLYVLMGWTYDPLPAYWTNRCVVIGFPHTSNMDTVRALTYIKIAGVNARLLVKSDWFFFPLSVILKHLGGIPVKRDKAHGFVDFAVDRFKNRDHLILAMVPEGTRKHVSTIKTGFWHIARCAEVPIICWYLDNAAKRTKWAGKIDPSGNISKDLNKIQELYKNHGFSIPLTKNKE